MLSRVLRTCQSVEKNKNVKFKNVASEYVSKMSNSYCSYSTSLKSVLYSFFGDAFTIWNQRNTFV